MSDPRQVAKTLRDVSQEGSDPAERRRAMLHLLRKEFDHLPAEEAIALLAQVRAEVAPGDRISEASHLWECMGGASSAPAPVRAASHSAGDSSGLAREVLGARAVPDGAFSPEMAERWSEIVKLVFETLLRYEAEFQRLYRKLKEGSTAATGATSLGVRLERPIQEIIVDILEGRRELAELAGRLERFSRAAWFMYDAHAASAASARDSLAKLLDPNVIQGAAVGKDYWSHYRRLYRQELWDFNPQFTDIFINKPFLAALMKALKKP